MQNQRPHPAKPAARCHLGGATSGLLASNTAVNRVAQRLSAGVADREVAQLIHHIADRYGRLDVGAAERAAPSGVAEYVAVLTGFNGEAFAQYAQAAVRVRHRLFIGAWPTGWAAFSVAI